MNSNKVTITVCNGSKVHTVKVIARTEIKKSIQKLFLFPSAAQVQNEVKSTFFKHPLENCETFVAQLEARIDVQVTAK